MLCLLPSKRQQKETILTASIFDPSASVATRYWAALPDGRIECQLCPRLCKLQDGARGLCFVRARQDDQIVLTSYGRSSGFCIDPIEKKPLAHFLPGSAVLSFGTAGCNLACSFCQNHDMSKSRDTDTLAEAASPEMIARLARQLGCASVAFTYNDPVIFLEYAVDVARACHAVGVRAVAVTAGFICPEPRREFFQPIDAVNVDLKAFSEQFYRDHTRSQLEVVKETLLYLRHQTRVWLEITCLLIPGKNDSDEELQAMCTWIVKDLGADIPLHFSAFHPDYRMMDVPPTPVATLIRARQIALRCGVQHVYLGNVLRDDGRQATCCTGCGARLIARSWHRMQSVSLTPEGRCMVCGTRCVGVFDPDVPLWAEGRRVKIRVADFVRDG